jgi:hypothetical protein
MNKLMVFHHDHVVHAIFMDFDEGPINKFNVTLKLWKLCHQNLSFFNSGLLGPN